MRTWTPFLAIAIVLALLIAFVIVPSPDTGRPVSAYEPPEVTDVTGRPEARPAAPMSAEAKAEAEARMAPARRGAVRAAAPASRNNLMPPSKRVAELQDARGEPLALLAAAQVSTWNAVYLELERIEADPELLADIAEVVDGLQKVRLAPNEARLKELQVDQAKIRAQIGVRGLAKNGIVADLMQRLNEDAQAHRLTY